MQSNTILRYTMLFESPGYLKTINHSISYNNSCQISSMKNYLAFLTSTINRHLALFLLSWKQHSVNTMKIYFAIVVFSS